MRSSSGRSSVRVAFFSALLMLLLLGAAPADTPKLFDWEALTQEATGLLSAYIQINTSNPPGNELAAARMLKEKFLHDGIPAAVFQPAPGRGIVAARLRGVGKQRKSLILLSHMDVVPADAKDWSVPPFSGQVKGGEIWGRGALDDKGPGVVFLMAMLAIKRARILLNRDIVFVATADEEMGGKLGAGWVVDHQPNLYRDAGYVLNEGGGVRTDQAGHRYYSVAITEKSPLWLRLTATAASGHAASPPDHTAVTRLIKALDKLDDYQPPIKVLPVVEDYFHRLAVIDQDPIAIAAAGLTQGPRGPRLRKTIHFRAPSKCDGARYAHAHGGERGLQDQHHSGHRVGGTRLPAVSRRGSQGLH